MVLVRLAYVADLPAPADLVAQLGMARRRRASAARRRPRVARRRARAGAGRRQRRRRRLGTPAQRVAVRAAAAPARGADGRAGAAAAAELSRGGRAFRETSRGAAAHASLRRMCTSCISSPAASSFRLDDGAPRDLANRLGKLLGAMDRRSAGWSASRASPASRRLREQAERAIARLRSEAAQHPLVRAVLEPFPGARIESGARDSARPSRPRPTVPTAPTSARRRRCSDEESRPDDEAGAGDAGQDGRDAGAARPRSR